MGTKIFLGTQGWNYEGWVGSFYPRGVSSKEVLSLYAKIFDTVEIDSTFYAIPPENTVNGWNARTPSGFKFSVKLPSEITHKNRLRNSQEHLNRFVERMLLLGEKLGCVLIQLPPDFSPNEMSAFSSFLKSLPSSVRFAVEFRDPGWLNERAMAEMAAHNVALTLTDSRWINRDLSFRMIENYTAEVAYVRWMGPRELTDFSRIQIDRTKELNEWAEAFERLRGEVKAVFGYFNNHYQGHSPASCNLFKDLIGLATVDPESLVVQPSLF
ncbi:MAG: DUF72 domain-containing protein [Blastocatellia bacterium]